MVESGSVAVVYSQVAGLCGCRERASPTRRRSNGDSFCFVLIYIHLFDYLIFFFSCEMEFFIYLFDYNKRLISRV